MPLFSLQDVIDGIKEKSQLRRLQRQPIYRKQDYLLAIKADYLRLGLPEPDWLDQIPDAPPGPPPSPPSTEPNLWSHDWIVLNLDCDESTQRVKCRVSYALCELHKEFYSQGLPPPIEHLVRSYKELGFSDDYLMVLIKNHDRRIARMKKHGPMLDKIFKPDSSSKKKKKKDKQEIVEEEEEHEEDIEVDEEEEEEEVPDDENFDMEVDEDDENDVDDVEEEYISD